jgi:nucleoside phosphorylase
MWFRYIVLVGIAGAIRRGNNDEAIALGDVVVADRIIDTEFQKITDYGAVLRDREFRVNPELIHEIKFFDGRATWMGLSGRSPRSRAFDGAPRMHIGPVISGNKVMASMHEARYLSERIARSSNSGLPLAIEMEAIGVAVAAARSGYGDRFIMFRGINDFADANKAADEEIWRERACGSAADIAIEYIRSVALSHGWGKELEREA